MTIMVTYLGHHISYCCRFIVSCLNIITYNLVQFSITILGLKLVKFFQSCHYHGFGAWFCPKTEHRSADKLSNRKLKAINDDIYWPKIQFSGNSYWHFGFEILRKKSWSHQFYKCLSFTDKIFIFCVKLTYDLIF